MRKTELSFRRVILGLLLSQLLVLAGCSSVSPAPAQAERHLQITIDSLPSGADVYALRQDGTLGAKIGRTPLKLNVGYAFQWLHDEMGLACRVQNILIWSPDSCVRAIRRETRVSSTALSIDAGAELNCVVTKDGYAPYYIRNARVANLAYDKNARLGTISAQKLGYLVPEDAQLTALLTAQFDPLAVPTAPIFSN